MRPSLDDRRNNFGTLHYLGDVVKGEKRYRYYFASWKVGDKVKNVYVGSPRKMTLEEATVKAREMKRQALEAQNVRSGGVRARRYPGNEVRLNF